jgi:hypothetical protein
MIWLSENKEVITQGSIIDGVDWNLGDDNPLSIVLSNACDIEHEKSSYLIVIALLPAVEILSVSKEFKSKTSTANANKALAKGAWRSLTEFLTAYIHNKNITRYYFIDPTPIIDSQILMADFQLIKSIDIHDASNFENIAHLSNPFLEQMIIHFASYTARIPSDRVDAQTETNLINELACGYTES